MKAKIKYLAKSVVQKGIAATADSYIHRSRYAKEAFDTIQNYHLFTGEKKGGESFHYEPLVSIITPLYNTREKYLRELIDSVRDQVYENWELCFADGSDEEHAYVESVCKEYGDKRIKYHRLAGNEGIVGNTNQCIALAAGEYYGLLDHDDVLHPMALYECVRAINQDADFIYTDEMKFSGQIKDATDIVCKNDFSRYELRSHNYICHFVVFKAQLLQDMEELYRSKCEGSQDYDMVLRLTEQAKKIVHIPKILYYWRVHEGSVSMDLSVKQYAVDAAKTAISDHLQRCGESGKVECNYPYETIYRLTYNIKDFPHVTMIWNGNISVREQRKYLHRITEITDYPRLEILCSGRKEQSLRAHDIRIKVVKAQNMHKILRMNQMSERARGELLLFMDHRWIPQNRDWLKELVMYAVKKDVGAVGPFVKDRIGRVVSAGAMLDVQKENGILNLNQGKDSEDQGYEANMKHVRAAAILPGGCLMVSKEKFEAVGRFDKVMEDFADADLCLKLKQAGCENIWTPFAALTSVRGIKDRKEGSPAFMERWICRKPDSMKEEIPGCWCHPLLKKLNYI